MNEKIKDKHLRFSARFIDPYRKPERNEPNRPRRNDKCPCGSGKKYKHCCLRSLKVSQNVDIDKPNPAATA